MIVLYFLFLVFLHLYVGEDTGWAFYLLSIVTVLLFTVAEGVYEDTTERIEKLERRIKNNEQND